MAYSEELADWLRFAFDTLPPTENGKRLIQNLLDNPGGTCAALSEQHGWAPNVWDMQMGKLISRHIKAVGAPPALSGLSGLGLLTVYEHGPDGKLRYTMRPEAVTAFSSLGFHEKS